MQNHLLQILSVVAMEQPASLNAEDIRSEKVKVLHSIRPLKLEDVLLGQYTKSPDGKEPGYLDDPTVPKNSNTPTFAAAVFSINNPRWEGLSNLDHVYMCRSAFSFKVWKRYNGLCFLNF